MSPTDEFPWLNDVPPRVMMALRMVLLSEGAEAAFQRLTSKRQREPIPWERRQAVFKRDAHVCRYCGSADAHHIDHIIPISAGGTDDIDNLAAACPSCNARKGVKVGCACSGCHRLTWPGNTAHVCQVPHCVACRGHSGPHIDDAGWRWRA